jgi:hypothetical protein
MVQRILFHEEKEITLQRVFNYTCLWSSRPYLFHVEYRAKGFPAYPLCEVSFFSIRDHGARLAQTNAKAPDMVGSMKTRDNILAKASRNLDRSCCEVDCATLDAVHNPLAISLITASDTPASIRFCGNLSFKMVPKMAIAVALIRIRIVISVWALK